MFDWVLNMPLLPVKSKKEIILHEKLKTLSPLFMDRAQLSQGYRATKRRQVYFLPLSPQEFLVLI